jgi:hypothetical protein
MTMHYAKHRYESPEAKIPSVDIFGRSASSVDRILKGTKPAFVDSLRALGDVTEWFNERLNCRGMSVEMMPSLTDSQTRSSSVARSGRPSASRNA